MSGAAGAHLNNLLALKATNCVRAIQIEHLEFIMRSTTTEMFAFSFETITKLTTIE